MWANAFTSSFVRGKIILLMGLSMTVTFVVLMLFAIIKT